MKVRSILFLASASALFLAMTGCGSSEEPPTKGPDGSSYYQGEMQPKGGKQGATSGGATEGAKSAPQ